MQHIYFLCTFEYLKSFSHEIVYFELVKSQSVNDWLFLELINGEVAQ